MGKKSQTFYLPKKFDNADDLDIVDMGSPNIESLKFKGDMRKSKLLITFEYKSEGGKS